MDGPLDLANHRETIMQRLTTLGENLNQTAEGSQALAEFVMLLHSLMEIIEARIINDEKQMELFQALIVGNARLSADYDKFRERCLMIEEDDPDG